MKTRLLIYFSISLTLASCQPENTPPVALVYSLPVIGDTTTVFLLEGKNSSDNESSYFALRYRWDTNSDGIWETQYSTQPSYTSRFSKTGYQKYILEVADTDGGTATVIDSVFLLVSNQAVMDTLTDLRDGHRYAIVKVGDKWWMAENLRFGTPIDFKTPFTDNGLVEFIYFNNNQDLNYYGSLYTWVEANQYPMPALYRDICPPGWRIPSGDQWLDLFKSYSQPFDVPYYFGTSSITGLGIEMNGFYKYGDPDNPMKGEYQKDRYGVRYWTSQYTGEDTTRYFTGINFSRDSCYLVNSYNHPEWIKNSAGIIIGYKTPEACYVRCIKQ